MQIEMRCKINNVIHVSIDTTMCVCVCARARVYISISIYICVCVCVFRACPGDQWPEQYGSSPFLLPA